MTESEEDAQVHGEHWSDDGDLADEIELYGDLVVAASETDGEMTVGEIDAALGIDETDESLHGPAGAPGDAAL